MLTVKSMWSKALSTAPDTSWWIVVPVKRIEHAKSRLHPELAGPLRRDLARAFALDTLTAVLATSGVERVVLVSSEPTVTGNFVNDARVQVITDPGHGLTAAIDAGIAAIGRSVHIGVLLGDLPALRSTDLAEALVQARTVLRGFVADADGTGTTLLTATNGTRLRPRFGTGSAAAHTAAGHLGLMGVGEPLRRDVDSPKDLEDAVRLGVGPRTAHVLAKLSVESR